MVLVTVSPLFVVIQKQPLLETRQSPFRISKHDNFHYGAFAWIENSKFDLNAFLRKSCWLEPQ